MSYSKEHYLRYYIALSAPPTRAPVRGDEPFMRPEAGFNPSWFHKSCDVDFSKRWHKDPKYRMQTIEKMSGEVRKRFPGRNIGGVNDNLPPDLITGLYGCAVVPCLFGQPITYFNDKWPQPIVTPLDDDQADTLEPIDYDNDTLEPIDYDNSELFANIMEQIDEIENLTGAARGFLNWQGVLNIAFRLRHDRIFMDLFDTPQRAHHIFDVITTSLIDGIKRLLARQKQAGTEYKFATVSNCVVNMISPEHYAEFLLPYDLKIRAEFEHFGIHNCAWVVDPYMESYSTVPKLGYLDMGITSDLNKASRLFGDTRRNILYTSMDLQNKSKDQIRADFEKIAAEFAPCDVGLPDIEMDVPDDRVLLAMDLCRELSARYGA
ncbi:MAG: uroporphyrinogen decarboxylase/cobalamine-independent methonine synthase family protein [Planctomycetota bacterium]